MIKKLKGSNKKGIKLQNGRGYIVFTQNKITQRIINLSNSINQSVARKNNAGTKYILEVLEPIADIFLDEIIYSEDEIKTVLQASEWQSTNP